MRTYKQLTREQRYQIYALMKMGHNQTQIANFIGVDKSTISRELSRNRGLATAAVPQVTPTKPQATATIQQVAEETAGPEETLEPVPFPLSEFGSYYIGKRSFTFEDPSANGRRIGVSLLYPALLPEGSRDTKLLAGANRDPDLSRAPYPLILTGPDTGDQLFQTHLASHGFVMATVRFPEYNNQWDLGVVDHPRDILFALDQIASQPLEGLEGVIDSDHAGVAGYSWEGFYTFTLSGVRINPEYYLSFCKQDPAMVPEMSAWYFGYVCNLSKIWDEFTAYVGEETTDSDDGLWQALTDERIRAVMPMPNMVGGCMTIEPWPRRTAHCSSLGQLRMSISPTKKKPHTYLSMSEALSGS